MAPISTQGQLRTTQAAFVAFVAFATVFAYEPVFPSHWAYAKGHVDH